MDSFRFRNRAESGDAEIEELATPTIGAALEMFMSLGPRMPEIAYRESLSLELNPRCFVHVCEAPVQIFYKGRQVAEGRVDILVGKKLIVELKGVDALASVHRAQVISYLAAMNLPRGLLINFNVLVLADGM